MDELGLERRERDGHGRGHRRLEGRQGHDQGDRGRQERERHGDGHGRAEAADDGVVQAGVVVEDREGALQGERQVDGLGPADDPVQGWLVQVHDPGHRRRAGAHGVHEWFRVGQQFRQGLHGVWRQCRCGRRSVRSGRHTKLHHNQPAVKKIH